MPSFEGVIGKDLSNPIPSYAPGAERGVVPLHVATSMDAPNPDAGEEYPHTSTQLFGTVLPEGNQFAAIEAMQPPFNTPDDPSRQPSMDGFVIDYVNTFRSEIERRPSTTSTRRSCSCYTPEQVPVISGIAKGFATFDHWFCEVPSQTFTNRSFYHAATASGLLVNAPYDRFPTQNDAETIFERLEAAGLSWRVYVDPTQPFSATGVIHAPRLSKYFATHFSSLDDFFDDCENGKLPTYSFIEPSLLHAHNDYHPAMNALTPGLSADSPSSILGGEDLLARVYTAVRGASTSGGSNFANTLFLVAFDEAGGTYDHIPPPAAPPPDPAAPEGQYGFRFNRLARVAGRHAARSRRAARRAVRHGVSPRRSVGTRRVGHAHVRVAGDGQQRRIGGRSRRRGCGLAAVGAVGRTVVRGRLCAGGRASRGRGGDHVRTDTPTGTRHGSPLSTAPFTEHQRIVPERGFMNHWKL